MKRIGSMLLTVACLSLLTATACSRKPNRTTKVTVAGEAMTKVEPDAAVLVVSVVTQNSQAIVAQQENARKTEAVANAIKAAAGTDAEIKTSDYTLQPQYDHRDHQLPKIIGYDARNSVIVTMSELKNVGAVIDAASGAGANSIGQVSFILRQTSPARGQALADATKQAMNKAESIAQALGGRLSRVVEETEQSTVAGSQVQETMRYEDTKNVTPITAGHLNIRSNVQLIVEIET